MILQQIVLISRVERRHLLVDGLECIVDGDKKGAADALFKRTGEVEVIGEVDEICKSVTTVKAKARDTPVAPMLARSARPDCERVLINGDG